MDPLSRVTSDSVRVPRVHRDQRPRDRRKSEDSFDTALERESKEPNDDAPPAPREPQSLQSDRPQSRKSPSDGEFHIDVLA